VIYDVLLDKIKMVDTLVLVKLVRGIVGRGGHMARIYGSGSGGGGDRAGSRGWRRRCVWYRKLTRYVPVSSQEKME
jgi:hypothetical protein